MPTPDWRWRRACYLVAHHRHATPKREDPPTLRAVRFLRAAKKLCSEWGYARLAQREPDLVAALQLHFRGERTLELHARVLARQSSKEIADIMSLPTAVVQTYLDLFFDVAQRLHATFYVTHVVAGVRPTGPATAETMMLLAAYHHGPHVIAPWLDYFAHAFEYHDLTTPVGRRRESIELFLAAQNLPDDAATRQKLVKLSPYVFTTAPFLCHGRSAAECFADRAAEIVGNLPWYSRDDDAHVVEMVTKLSKQDLVDFFRALIAQAA